MGFPPWFLRFCSPGADRFTALTQALEEVGVKAETLNVGPFRHVQVRGSRPSLPQPGEKVVIAHYDRVGGTPGANDNGASVWSLVDYLASRSGSGPALRVVFTDGEELGSMGHARDQGSFALAQHWGPIPSLFPVVLDMTGIGDTIVLGHLGEELIRKTRPQAPPTDLDAYARTRLRAKRWLATCGRAVIELNTPFSDDLGLFLAGIPAVQISLLPRKEAKAYRSGVLPPAWKTMHRAEDMPEALWPSSRVLLSELLKKLEEFPL